LTFSLDLDIFTTINKVGIMTNKLKDIAFRIHIDPQDTAQHATKVETLIKVLKNITISYKNFIEAEFLKNEEYKKVYSEDNNKLNKIRKELELLVIDLNFGSAELALAPAFEETKEMFENPTRKWEVKTFKGFKQNVLYSDYNDTTFLSKIEKRYTKEERFKIYKPYFDIIDDTGSYKLNLKNKNNKIEKTILKPQKEFLDIILPKKKTKKKEVEYKTMNIVAQVAETPGMYDLPISSIKKVISYKEIIADISPYNPSIIKYENTTFTLTHKLECIVTLEEDNFIIRNNELDITVWGQTRAEVEEAFAFTFSALYQNYYKEVDKNLTAKAKVLKNKLKSIIKK